MKSTLGAPLAGPEGVAEGEEAICAKAEDLVSVGEEWMG